MDDLGEYISRIESEFCPFIGPSRKKGLLSISYCRCDESVMRDAGNIFLRRLVEEIDLFRAQRAENFEMSALICRNVVLECQLDEIAVAEIFGWVHFALKKAFAETGIVFGKFYVGHGFHGVGGMPIPDPPMPFLSIRTVLERVDPHRFYNFMPEYGPRAARWSDDLSVSSGHLFRRHHEIVSADWYGEISQLASLRATPASSSHVVGG